MFPIFYQSLDKFCLYIRVQFSDRWTNASNKKMLLAHKNKEVLMQYKS